jgi:hypothetical protein
MALKTNVSQSISNRHGFPQHPRGGHLRLLKGTTGGLGHHRGGPLEDLAGIWQFPRGFGRDFGIFQGFGSPPQDLAGILGFCRDSAVLHRIWQVFGSSPEDLAGILGFGRDLEVLQRIWQGFGSPPEGHTGRGACLGFQLGEVQQRGGLAPQELLREVTPTLCRHLGRHLAPSGPRPAPQVQQDRVDSM